MARKIAVVFALFFLLESCSDQMIYSEYSHIQNGKWLHGDTLRFKIPIIDTLHPNHLYINLRNSDEYPFSNLFLITAMQNPKGDVEIDTLEYKMAEADGTWLGTGLGALKESKLWYKENIVFPSSGVYQLKVIHAVRKNGEVDGVSALIGITDVGLQIEKIEPK